MKTARLRFSISAAIVIGSAIGAISMEAQDAKVPAPHQHRPISIRRFHENQTAVDSTNWSGYAVTGANGSVTYAAGSWIVPAATCSSQGTEYAAFWVGIDGWTSPTVEQIGTDSDCSNGTPSGSNSTRIFLNKPGSCFTSPSEPPIETFA